MVDETNVDIDAIISSSSNLFWIEVQTVAILVKIVLGR
jgi:hypothetical protein